MRQGNKTIGLQDLVEGFLFSLQAEGHAPRTHEYTAGNGSRRFTKSKPSTAWPYYKALRRLFNWGVEEGFLEENLVKGIHFKAAPGKLADL